MASNVFDSILDDDSELIALWMTACGVEETAPSAERNPSIFDQRLAWNDYCELHIARGTFDRRLRMPKSSFDKLLSYVGDYLQVNETQANKRGGGIVPELCLYCTIRWLAGGSYLDICDVAGISKASFYRVIWRTITAIVHCPELQIPWPTSNEQIARAVQGFTSISTECAIQNCVGVVDGYLLRIKVPSKKEVANVKSFFSGHYQCYGVNVQAVADHNSRFIYFAIAAPGVTADRDAICQCNLKELIEKLPFGICVIGDAAYEGTEHMVPVYSGLDRLRKKNDNFNFYASQLRIRVEMAFGLMQIKWGILQRPVGCSMRNLKWLAQAVARLHNFVIDERLARNEDPVMEIRTTAGDNDGEAPSYFPTVPEDENGDPIALDRLFQGSIRGHSHIREAMVERVSLLQLQRPASNRIRKNFNSSY